MPSYARTGGKILRRTQIRDYPCECRRTCDGKMMSNPFRDAAPLDSVVTGILHMELMDLAAVLNLVDNPTVHEQAREVRERLDRVLAAL